MAKVTIKTVAQAVGVSTSTVSNAYNKPGQLSAELRARVLATATELGYAGPDAAARSLRSGRAAAVGVLLTQRLSYAFSDPYAVGFLTGLAEVMEESATSVLLLPLSDSDELTTETMRSANIDALTSLCLPDGSPAVTVARTRRIPIVNTVCTLDPDESYVAIDDRLAGQLIGDHLHRLGHRRVTVVSDEHTLVAHGGIVRDEFDDVDCPDCRSRLTGLAGAMPGAELQIITGGHNAVSSGRRAAPLALDAQDRPSAIVALSDVLALGVLEAMTNRGLVAGRDVSVAGFDDISAAAGAGLTTVRQPIVDKGRAVGELLLDLDRTPRQLMLPIELVVRSSTGPAPRS